ncbi:ATP-binding cassette domain-containing protein [Candidatus Pacearchaeota archaeon]|nr:ATP-binding cassette domain-containing protein [Candidatus Pacearchaeota archaeon]
MFAIEVDNLTKKFGELTAVDSISIKVKEGELLGLLGPNGAGKTTTISMLSTLLKPTAGTARISGFEIAKEAGYVRENIGIVFQEPSLDDQLTGFENLDFHSRMYGLSKAERAVRISKMLGLVDLTDKAKVLVENYSGGMKRRLEIARSLIHKPKVLFLDEPTIGLDAQTRRHIWDYIKKLNREEKVTIVLTTHYMEEADFLCDRVAIIDYGKIVAINTPKNLKKLVEADVILLEIQIKNIKFQKFLEYVKKISWVRRIRNYNGFLALNVLDAERKIPKIMNIARHFQVRVNSVNLHKPSLEDVFLRFTGRTIREEECKPEKGGHRLIPLK